MSYNAWFSCSWGRADGARPSRELYVTYDHSAEQDVECRTLMRLAGMSVTLLGIPRKSRASSTSLSPPVTLLPARTTDALEGTMFLVMSLVSLVFLAPGAVRAQTASPYSCGGRQTDPVPNRCACGSSGAAVCGAGGVMAWERGRGEGARGRGGR